MNYNDFTKQYSISKTLRNELIPIGKTKDLLKDPKTNPFLENDFIRNKNYSIVKNLIDDYHRYFISKSLKNVSLDWTKLYNALKDYRSDKDNDNRKKSLSNTQDTLREQLIKEITKDKDYDSLFNKKLIEKLLPDFIKTFNNRNQEECNDALKSFNRFSTYFTGFFENRKNIYSKEAKSTSIANRIVNENFNKFFDNLKIYEIIKNNKELIQDINNEIKKIISDITIEDVFEINYYNKCLTQEGIDTYNQLIGGKTLDNGIKLQGINEKINLYIQKNKESKIKTMTHLYKQILSINKSQSFIPVGFTNQIELKEAIDIFKNQDFKNISEVLKTLMDIDKNLDKIYISYKKREDFSKLVYSDWNSIRSFYVIKEKEKLNKVTASKEEKIEKEIDNKDLSISEIDELNIDTNIKSCLINYFEELHRLIEIDYDKLYKDIDFNKDFQQHKEESISLKKYLDAILKMYQTVCLLEYKGNNEIDSNFYNQLQTIIDKLSPIVHLYNNTRNYVTKKPSEVKKIKLNFNCPTLANGWALNNELNYGCILLRKNSYYYLGIMEKNSHSSFKSYPSCLENENFYEKMVYLQAADPSKDVPNLLVINGKTVKKNGRKDADGVNRQLEELRNTYLPSEINEIRKRKSHLLASETFDKEDLVKYIDYYKQRTIEYFSDYKFTFKPSSDYNSFVDFTDDVNAQAYQIRFIKVSMEHINSLVDSGKLFLFQIYNKDFASGTNGRKNLHTLYWGNIFSEENLKNVCIKLNGQAEIFIREKATNLQEIVHKKDSWLVNKITSDGKIINDNLYQEIYKYKNKLITNISKEAKSLLESEKVICKKARFDIIKDNRFLEDKFLFHCPITLNFKSTSNKLNDKVREFLKTNDDYKVIGLDRGERHLIYLSLINNKGEVELQKTLNYVTTEQNNKQVKIDYHQKLAQLETNRDEARKNWQSISNIKELKEGYLSNIVHEIAKLMVEHKAIVVMEDLNFGFKRGRFKVEKQIYQKFEKMLIDKLNYLVFKNKDKNEPGGILNAYQLTNKFESFEKLGKQSGFLFYTQAAYTSKIDPVTGFVNMFDTRYKNVEQSKNFFKTFKSITYNPDNDWFEFDVDDYSKFNSKALKTSYKICTNKDRIKTVNENQKWSSKEVNLSEEFKALFVKHNIDINNNLKEQIINQNTKQFYESLLYLFKLTTQLRNSIVNSDVDYLISCVQDKNGNFFDSRIEQAKQNPLLPIDADANGAYNIARKGLMIINKIKQPTDNKKNLSITNKEWLEFAQEK